MESYAIVGKCLFRYLCDLFFAAHGAPAPMSQSHESESFKWLNNLNKHLDDIAQQSRCLSTRNLSRIPLIVLTFPLKYVFTCNFSMKYFVHWFSHDPKNIEIKF